MSLLTPRGIAELTGLSYRTVLRAITDGELPAYKLRGQLRVSAEAYEEWLGAGLLQNRQETFTREPSPTREQVGSIP